MHLQSALEKQQVRKAFDHAAITYDQAAVLQIEIGQRLAERLQYVKMQPSSIIDIGSVTGLSIMLLVKQYKQSRLVALDISESMLKQTRKRMRWQRKFSTLCADAEAIPIISNQFDLVFSNLSIQWCHLSKVLSECYRILKPGGLLMFTTFGPDTLKELKVSWSEVSQATHVNQFIDMHEIGDALLKQGYADPVMDVEWLKMTYNDVYPLMRDLKMIGAHNVNMGRNKGLTGKNAFQKMKVTYETYRENGHLPATYEVIYGHAWVGDKIQNEKMLKDKKTFPVTLK